MMKSEKVLMGVVFALVLGCCVLASGNVLAKADTNGASATQKFAIENMTCASCPITVRTAMRRVEGVSEVTIDYASKTAIAVYDPTLTTANAIAESSTSIGYPATVIMPND